MSSISVEQVGLEHIHQYGVVAAADWHDNHFVISDMVEKPSREEAPSDLIISGRYILQPEIFAVIEAQKPSKGGEIQLTDAMRRLLKLQPFYGLKYHGKTFDCGSKMGFLTANVAFALEHEVLGLSFKNALTEQVEKHGGRISWD